MSKFLAVAILVLSVGAASAQAARDTAPPPADPTIEQVPAAMADWFGKTVDKIIDPAATPDEPEQPAAKTHHRHEHN